MAELKGKVAIITGASRGIGKAIALKLAGAGVNIAVGAKTVEASEKTPGTIYDTMREVEKLGSEALAVQTDVRFDEQIQALVQKTVERFGRIDIVINNAGAIMFQSVEQMPVKRFDLITQLNYRAPFILCHETIPHLRKQGEGHIINMSPPPKIGALAAEGWAGRTGYLMSKFGMSHLTMGLAEELRADNISVNSLWPASVINTQATRVFAGMLRVHGNVRWYSPELLADASLEILKTSPAELTGQTVIAEDLLQLRGWTGFDKYEVAAPE